MVIMGACRPKGNEQAAKPLPIDSAQLNNLADSGGFLSQDGLDYEPLNTGTFDQLPAPLTAILNAISPGWSLAHLSPDYLKENKQNPTGPYFIQADLNQDTRLDYAVQFLYKDTLYINAYLQMGNDKLQEFKLSQYPYLAKPEKEESKLFISLLSEEEKSLIDSVLAKRNITLPPSVIAVKSSFFSQLFYFEGQEIRKVELPPGKSL